MTPRHHRDTEHHRSTIETPTETRPLHRRDTTGAPPRHHRDTTGTPPGHNRDTTGTPRGKKTGTPNRTFSENGRKQVDPKPGGYWGTTLGHHRDTQQHATPLRLGHQPPGHYRDMTGHSATPPGHHRETTRIPLGQHPHTGHDRTSTAAPRHHHRNITGTPAGQHWDRTITPLRHHCTTATPLGHTRHTGTPLHHRDTTGTPPGHHRDTTGTPPGHHRDTTGTPPGHHRDTTETPPGHQEEKRLGHRTVHSPKMDASTNTNRVRSRPQTWWLLGNYGAACL